MLVNTKEMFSKAYKEGYAVGAFNINNMETIQAITEAANDLKSPVILQVSAGAINYAGLKYLMKLVEATIEENPNIPIALHLDHGANFEICKKCIDAGFTSVMIDGSSYEFSQNIKITKQVVDYAHNHNVVVEGELGELKGLDNSSSKNLFTDPTKVKEFVSRTNVDSLAIAIGTSHGAYKFKEGQIPKLRFDILKEISEQIPNFPIVLHGSSSVIQPYVDKIRDFGGELINPMGVPEEMLCKAAKMAVCKINIDSDLRLAMTAGLREAIHNKVSNIDPREFIKPGKAMMKYVIKHKIKNVLVSENKA